MESATPEWDQIHGLRGTNFGDLAEQALSLTETINTLKESLEEVKAGLMAEMVRSQQTSVRAGALRVTYSAGKKASRKLDETLLLKNGVKMTQIEKSYVEGVPGKPYLTLTSKVEDAG